MVRTVKAPQKFAVGVNYWPRSSAVDMWRNFDIGEIREDFTRIAGLGIDTLRFFVRWDDFQPKADVVDAQMLERLETFVCAAHEAGLRVVPALFCGFASGVTFLPEWSLDARRTPERYRAFTGVRESPRAAANIYAGALLEAQLFFARTVGLRLRGHPALAAWDIGHAFSNVCEPPHGKVSSGDHGAASAAEPQVARWSRSLTAVLRETSGIPATAGTHCDDLTSDRDIRLGSLCAPFAFASIQGSSVEAFFARNRLDPEVVPFFAMLTAAFALGKPVTVTGFGSPTCPPNKFTASERFALPGESQGPAIAPEDAVFATYPCLSEGENAAYCTSVLERLHADGRLGAYWWCWTDYAPELAIHPPFDEAPHAMTYGLIRADGSEKPVAGAIRAFAQRALDVVAPRDMPMISSTYYYRTLPTSAYTLYEAFLGFVSERRGVHITE